MKDFWNGQKNIVLCDPNILACKDWRVLFTQLIESKAVVDFNQGLDIRLITPDKMEALNQIKIKQIHFAWDRFKDKDLILEKLKLFAESSTHKLNIRNLIVYTIVNFDTTFKEDLERVYTLRDIGFWPYIMIYDKEHCDNRYKRLARWVNNRVIFSKCLKFDDYK